MDEGPKTGKNSTFNLIECLFHSYLVRLDHLLIWLLTTCISKLIIFKGY